METTPSKLEKLAHQLFIGKVAEIIGIEKTTELLKESKDAFEKPLTEPMKSIEEEAYQNCKKSGFNNTSYAAHCIQSFIDGYELANSQTTNHLKKLIEEVKEKADYIENHPFQVVSIQSIDKLLNDYITNNELK